MAPNEPRDTDELYDMVEEAAEDLDELGDEELANYLVELTGAVVGESEVKAKHRDMLEEFVDSYQDIASEAEAMEEQRDQYREFGIGIADALTDYLNGDAYAINQMTETLEDAYQDLDLTFYDTTPVEEALDELRETVDEKVQEFRNY